MLDQKKVSAIARSVAVANLTSAAIKTVASEPFTDSEGRDALRITIVLKPDAPARIKGDATLNTLVQIEEKLRKAGEERFPIVEYATEEELNESGAS